MVSHPLSIREALGSIPSVSSLVFLAASPQCLGGFTPAQYARGPGFNLQRVQFSVPGIVTPVYWWYHTRSACGRRWVQSPACTVWCFRHRRTRGVMVSHPLSMREPWIQSSACSWHRRPRGGVLLFLLSMLERPCSIWCNPIESEAGVFNLVFSSGRWYHTRSACGRRWVQSPACTVWCFRHRRTRGVMLSHPLSMRKALGSILSVFLASSASWWIASILAQHAGAPLFNLVQSD